MDKLNLAEIVRSIILQYKVEGTINNAKANDLEKVLHLMVMDKYRVFEDDAKDLTQEALLHILVSFKNNINEFWSEVTEPNEENDKRIVGYVYGILKSAFRVSNDSFEKRESVNLERNLKEVCNELVESGKLESNKNNYHLSGLSNLKLCNLDIGAGLYPIRNKEGTISKKKLTDLVISLFDEELEKYEISFSDLLEIISSMTEIGSDKLVSISDKMFEDDENGTFELTLTSDENFNNPEAIADAELLTDKWYKTLESIYDEEEFRLRSNLFVLKYGYRLTLNEISDMIPDRLSKSSVDNYIKEFIRLSGMNTDIRIDDPQTGCYIEAFILYLNDRYKVSEKYMVNKSE